MIRPAAIAFFCHLMLLFSAEEIFAKDFLPAGCEIDWADPAVALPLEGEFIVSCVCMILRHHARCK